MTLLLLLFTNWVVCFGPNTSFKGATLSLIVFLLCNISSRTRLLFYNLIVIVYALFAIWFTLISLPPAINTLSILGLSNVIQNWELLIYSFKQKSILGYDANYIGLIFIIFAVYYSRPILFLTAFLTGSRTPIGSYIVTKLLVRIFYVRSLIFYTSFFFIILLIYTNVNFDFFISARMKQETVINFLNNIESGNIKLILFGNGIDFAPGLNTTGHTLYGVAAKNGILYALFSLLILLKLRSNGNSKVNQMVFIVYLSSLISLTAFNFVFPLIYALSGLIKRWSKN